MRYWNYFYLETATKKHRNKETQTHGQTDRQRNKQSDRQTNRQTDRKETKNIQHCQKLSCKKFYYIVYL